MNQMEKGDVPRCKYSPTDSQQVAAGSALTSTNEQSSIAFTGAQKELLIATEKESEVF